MEVICQSRGTPLPRITWVRQDGHKWVVAEDVPGLRQVWIKIFFTLLNCFWNEIKINDQIYFSLIWFIILGLKNIYLVFDFDQS